jgi:cytochrome c
LKDVLFMLDPGTVRNPAIDVVAVVSGSGATPGGIVSASIGLSPAPTGSASHGATLYASNCATCHGKTGAGTAANADGTYTMAEKTYDFPAPGLNAATGNLAGDRSWNSTLLGLAARADVDNHAVALRPPMPDYLTAETGKALTTQDFADIYEFLQTQSQ